MLGKPREPIEGEQVEDVDCLQVILLTAGSWDQLAQFAVEVLKPCVVFLELCEAPRLEEVEGAGLMVRTWMTREYARLRAGLNRGGAPGRGCTRWL